ncbi:hypothetical protein FBEOM_4489 [Fusarium beomiforme]|uniref:Uncharacterized protein n=1 Tax=Fusarium beomiforme TaxID=44412 RepID=A0A9P5APM3_9HYPO|nr:hypothetical protein FBEOM_4489 [Fusarium beomiforme]
MSGHQPNQVYHPLSFRSRVLQRRQSQLVPRDVVYPSLTAKLEPKMPAVGFLILPVEIQMKIIQMLIPPMILPEHITDHGIVVQNIRAATANLIMVCKQFRSVLFAIRPLVGEDAETGQQFTFDPTVDTLLVKKGVYPLFTGNSIYDTDKHLAIRRVLSFSDYPMLPMHIDPTGEMSEDGEEWDLSSSGTNDRWKKLRFEMEIPLLHHLPYMEEMIVVVQNATHDWHIGSFQQEGPDPKGPRLRGWGRYPDVDCRDLRRLHGRPINPYDSAFYKKCTTMRHTGIQWAFPLSGDLISARWDRFLPYYIPPMIRFHGYSKTEKDQPDKEYALGGKWAGFRYWIDKKEVEFRPLMWEEVEHIVHRQHQPERGRKLPEDQDPQLIARV